MITIMIRIRLVIWIKNIGYKNTNNKDNNDDNTDDTNDNDSDFGNNCNYNDNNNNYHSGFTILINIKHQKLTSNKKLSVKTFIKTIFFLFLLQDLLPGSSPLVKGRPRPRVNELKVTLQILFWVLEAEDSWFLQGRKGVWA